MHILLVAATGLEIAPAIQWLEEQVHRPEDPDIELLVTGVGSINTTYWLTEAIHSKKPSLLLQAGIAGSFDPQFAPGSLVLVGSEIPGDLGVEENNVFRDLFDMGLQDADAAPFHAGQLPNPGIGRWTSTGLPVVTGVTVNEITTRPSRIAHLQEKYGAAIESMEGAAFHYVCLMQGIPFVQLRAISNMAGERDKSRWKMKEAIKVLNDTLIRFFKDPTLMGLHDPYK